MFAHRTNWQLTSNTLTQQLGVLYSQNRKIIDLTQSNPTVLKFRYPSYQILKALISKKNLIYEPSAKGLHEARQAISQYYKRKGCHVHPEQIFLTSSTSEAYSFLFKLLLNSREEVLIPAPSYPLFDYLADLNDVNLKSYSLEYQDRWMIHANNLKNALTTNSRALILVNPNNPTGSFVKREELAAINHICREHHLSIICDEVFLDYHFHKKDTEVSLSLVENRDVLTFTLSGISKVLGLPQMKLGWIVVSGPEGHVRETMERLEVICDTFLSVNTPAQHALQKWFTLYPAIHKDVMRRILRNQEFIGKILKGVSSCQCLNSEGGWYAILRMRQKRSDEDWALDFLNQDRVYVHPGYFFEMQEEGCVVISLLVEPSIFKEGVKRMVKRINQTAHP